MDFSGKKPFRLLCDIPLAYMYEMVNMVLSILAIIQKKERLTLPDQCFEIDGHHFYVGIELDENGEGFEVIVREINSIDSLQSSSDAIVDPEAAEALSRCFRSGQDWRKN